MDTTEFWRNLAHDFQAAHRISDFTAYRSYYMGRYSSNPQWQLPTDQVALLAEFEALARRGATKLATLPASDLTVVWLEALWEEATTGPVRRGIDVFERNEFAGIMHLRGKIVNVFQASSTLCRKFEAKVLQDEFNEEQRNKLATKVQTQAEPKPIQEPVPAQRLSETTAAQIQRLRLECKWSIEDLAGKTGFDVRTVSRHLAGRTVPRLRNIVAYERIFSKALKRQVVINKMP